MSTAYNSGMTPSAPRIDFGWIGQAWALFRLQAGAWVGAIAIYLVLVALLYGALAYAFGLYAYFYALFTQGAHASVGFSLRDNLRYVLPVNLIFAPFHAVLSGGLYRMALRQARGETISATGVFSAFDVALPLILVGLLVAVLSGVIGLLRVRGLGVADVLWDGLLMFAPLAIVDRRLSAPAAITESFGLLKKQWLMTALFFLVLSIVSVLGIIVCGVGFVVTYPLFFLSLALGYLAFTEPDRPIGPLAAGMPDYGVAQPGVWPPPPNVVPPPPSWPPPPGTPGSA